jgi:putative cardiolipin synthase
MTVTQAWRGALAISFFFLSLSSCAQLPEVYDRDGSSAIVDYQDTSAYRFFAEQEAANPGLSGFSIMPRAREAFVARIGMTELAEKSLDLQYYIWESDETGRILADRVVQAADRGVRVRILVDDITLSAADETIASLDAHPNIEIRLFNPFANRGFRSLDFLGDMGRVNHRMHNKVIVMDNSIAIIGGRNIGNHYFDVATDANFRDLDIVAAGPIVRDVSNVFDYFWNGDWSYPIAALVDRPYGDADLEGARTTLMATVDQEGYPYPLDQKVEQLKEQLTEIGNQFVWAPGAIVWDDPESLREGAEHGEIIQALGKRLEDVERELLVEVAYFVPRKRGSEAIERLRERGVRVRVLTNSLSSNDVVAAHAGHASYRKRLVKAGVELHEVRADSAAVQKTLLSGDSRASLHTKTAVFDREAFFIGSFNFDPRSANINTEMGIYVENPELASQLIAHLDEGVTPANSYLLQLDEEGNLIWVTEENGEEVVYDYDPQTTFYQRFMADVMRLLPIESQL